jgi:pimeloyl-ACP methyl ester carboxylesterase
MAHRLLHRFFQTTLFCCVLQACGGGADAPAGSSTIEAPSVTSTVSAASAVAPPAATTTTPPRPLETTKALLDASLRCPGDLSGITRSPVLLVHGTAVNSRSTFSWNYVPALTAMGIPFCTVDLPLDGMGDIQIAAEYVVHAVREMAGRSGHKVQVIGHSQGGMVPRWALRFWPDIRPLVDDLVGLSPSNHGTIDARLICLPPCAPAIWQQRDDSAFLAALNRDFETLPGIDYSSVYTQIDEVVFPNLGKSASSRLAGDASHVRNIATQDVCPLNTADHLLIGTSDPVAYALALDAISHPGPANPQRVAKSVCSQLFMPGVQPLDFPFSFLNLTAGIASQLVGAPQVSKEPALKCYATGGC